MDSNSSWNHHALERSLLNERTWLWIFLAWLGIVALAFALLNHWEERIIEKRREHSPFLQVTNREYSLFLWQNPSQMRANRSNRLGYLSHFSSADEIHMIPAFADSYVEVSLENLYRYHTWKRLLWKSLAPRPIDVHQFQMFLRENPEWLPAFWNEAPSGYKNWVKTLDEVEITDLSSTPFTLFPYEVRLAFQGWKNYTLEREAIENLSISWGEMKEFLLHHPHYGRSFWINLLKKETPHYLQQADQEVNPGEYIPKEQISDFLQIGYFNYFHTQK